MPGIITTAEYKSWSGLQDTTYDTDIAMLIPIAQSIIESMTCCKFDSDTYTETHSGDGLQDLWVNAYGITSITSISEAANTSSPVVIDSSTYTHDGIRTVSRIPKKDGMRFGVDQSGMGRIVHPLVDTFPVFERDTMNIQIVYTAGYDTEDMPVDLKYAMYRLIDSCFDNRMEDMITLVNKADSGATRAMRTAAEQTKATNDLVRKYKRAM